MYTSLHYYAMRYSYKDFVATSLFVFDCPFISLRRLMTNRKAEFIKLNVLFKQQRFAGSLVSDNLVCFLWLMVTPSFWCLQEEMVKARLEATTVAKDLTEVIHVGSCFKQFILLLLLLLLYHFLVYSFCLGVTWLWLPWCKILTIPCSGGGFMTSLRTMAPILAIGHWPAKKQSWCTTLRPTGICT